MTPPVAEFAAGVDCGVVARNERKLERIFPGQHGGDLGIVAGGIAELGKIGTECIEDILEHAKVGVDILGGGIQILRKFGAFTVGGRCDRGVSRPRRVRRDCAAGAD